jgi:hypothetical protein
MNSSSFDWLSSGNVMPPNGFGREYYRKAIPLLRESGIKSASLEALTSPEKPDSGN